MFSALGSTPRTVAEHLMFSFQESRKVRWLTPGDGAASGAAAHRRRSSDEPSWVLSSGPGRQEARRLAFDGRSLVRPRRVKMKIRHWVWRKLIIQPLLSVVRCLVLQENRVEGAAPSRWCRDRAGELGLLWAIGSQVRRDPLVLFSYRRSVLSAAINRPNAATVNQRLSWVFQELNLSFLFLEVRSPSVPRTPKEAAAAVIQGK